MGKIVKSIFTVAAFATATVLSGGTFLGIKGLTALTAGLLGGAIGAGLGVLSSVLMPKPSQMDEQAGVKQPISNTIDTRKIIYGRQRVAGTEIFIDEFDQGPSNDIPNDTLMLARVVADHPVHSFGQFWLADQKIDFDDDIDQSGTNTGNAKTGKYKDHLYLRIHDGTQTFTDGRLKLANTDWTDAHVGYGVSYFTLKASFDAEVFPYGAGELRNCAIEIEGKPVYDPREAGHDINDPTTWEYSTNPALCIYDYLRDDVLGNPVPDIEINTDSIISAANICDEDVPVVGDGNPTIKRYSFNGVVDSGRDKFTNLQTMLTAMGGRLMWLGGEIHIFAAEERMATHALDEDVIISAQYDPLPPAESRYNEVRGTFISPEEHFEAQDFPPLVDAYEQAQEGERALSLNLPYTQDHRIAQRLAKITLGNSQQSILHIEALPAAAAFAPMDVVSISWANFGLVGEDFRILSQSINGGSGDRPVTVSMSLMREEASVYSWNVSEEQPRGTKPALNEVDLSLLPAPTGIVVSSDTLTSADGTKTTSLRVSWDAPHATVSVTYVDYRVAGGLWVPGGSAVRGDTDVRLFLPPSQTYEVRVRHSYGADKKSDYAYPVGGSASTDDIDGADRLVHRGAYNSGEPYVLGDVVTYQGSSYVCILASPAGILPTNTVYWALLASAGSYKDLRFRRFASQPSTPTGTEPSGWSDGPPAANGQPLWMTTIFKTFDEELIGSWTTPQEVGGSGLEVRYSSNQIDWHSTFLSSDFYMQQRLAGGSWSNSIQIVGEDGEDGDDGGYKDFVYKRSSSQPSKPSGTSHSGWSDGIPAENGNPVWESWVWRNANGSLSGNWSTPQNVVSAVFERQYSVNGTSGWHTTPSSNDRYFQERPAGTGSWSASVQMKGEGALTDLDEVDTPHIVGGAISHSYAATANANETGSTFEDTWKKLLNSELTVVTSSGAALNIFGSVTCELSVTDLSKFELQVRITRNGVELAAEDGVGGKPQVTIPNDPEPWTINAAFSFKATGTGNMDDYNIEVRLQDTRSGSYFIAPLSHIIRGSRQSIIELKR